MYSDTRSCAVHAACSCSYDHAGMATKTLFKVKRSELTLRRNVKLTYKEFCSGFEKDKGTPMSVIRELYRLK